MMRRARRLLSAAALALLLAAAAAHAAESSRELPYEDLARIPLKMEKVDDDHVFRGEFSVVAVDAGKALTAELRVDVLVEGRTSAVLVDRDGRSQLTLGQVRGDDRASTTNTQPT